MCFDRDRYLVIMDHYNVIDFIVILDMVMDRMISCQNRVSLMSSY